MKELNRGEFLLIILSVLSLVGLYYLMGAWILILGAIFVLYQLYHMGWTGFKKSKFTDWINPVKWYSVFWGWLIGQLFPLHILEQYVLRIWDPECHECVKVGKCKDCGCAVPEKMYVPGESCSKGNWGPIIKSKSEYGEVRKKIPVEILVKYKTPKNMKDKVEYKTPKNMKDKVEISVYDNMVEGTDMFESPTVRFSEKLGPGEEATIEWEFLPGIIAEDVVEDARPECGCTANVAWSGNKLSAVYRNTEKKTSHVVKAITLYLFDGVKKKPNSRGVMTWPADKKWVKVKFYGFVRGKEG